MSLIAFYAPLKPPGHPVPSGDREMARGLLAALAEAGFQTEIISDLRLFDKTGDATDQARLIARAAAESTRVIGALRGRSVKAVVTYHSYYKSPDLIGPVVADALNLPYVQIETTRARKRLTGPWARFARAAENAADRADVIYYLTHRDGEALKRDRRDGQCLIRLAPFLARRDLPAPSDPADGPMLAAAMMREGDKLASYALIADSLRGVPSDWRLDIAGDGPARPLVEAMMAPFGPRVRFLGRLDREAMQAAYRRASVFLWPGVNEAFGMVYMEAQAAGLPVVAQDRPGVRDVLAPGFYPAPGDGAKALGARIATLLSDPSARRVAGRAARAHIGEHHLLGRAAQTLAGGLAPLQPGGRA